VRFFRIAAILAAAVGIGALPGSASAQVARFRLVRAGQRKPVPERVLPSQPAAGRGQPNLRGMEGLPPKWVENLRDMPPEQQERFLENNDKFKALPPARQAQVRQNLQRWNSLTPEQKQRLHDAANVIEQMTPQQRQFLRNTLLPRWQAMPVDRRQVINNHLGMLRKMSSATQQAALNDPKFVEGLSPDEQAMLRDLNSLRNPPTP
jgi:hypothetical protein